MPCRVPVARTNKRGPPSRLERRKSALLTAVLEHYRRVAPTLRISHQRARQSQRI
jgi:hypothetical protein